MFYIANASCDMDVVCDMDTYITKKRSLETDYNIENSSKRYCPGTNILMVS